MKKFTLLLIAATMMMPAMAQEEQPTQEKEKKSGFSLTAGGRGEVAYTRNFGKQGGNEFALPMVAAWLECTFGKGWTVGAEVQFESGELLDDGNRANVLSIENMWIEKSFSEKANLKAGLMQVPVSGIINAGTPVDFFGVYIPLGESMLLPDTWLETGLSFWGEAGDWRYEAMIMPGLDSSLFDEEEWIHNGADCPLAFKTANSFAGAVRVDNTSVKDLRLSLSGYYGSTFNSEENKRKGSVMIGSFDFDYRPFDENLITRGGLTYGGQRKTGADASKNAFTAGVEAGYNMLSFAPRTDDKLYLFGRYDHVNLTDLHINRVAVGLNYFPIDEVVLKCEYSYTHNGFGQSAISLGVGFSGLFTK